VRRATIPNIIAAALDVPVTRFLIIAIHLVCEKSCRVAAARRERSCLADTVGATAQ